MAETDERYGRAGQPLRSGPFRFGLLAVAGGLLTYAGFLALHRLATILAMLVTAFFLAIGLNRPVAAMVRRGMRRPIAVAVLVVGVALAVLAGVVLVVPRLAAQIGAFFTALPGYLHTVADHTPGADPDKLGGELARTITPHLLSQVAAGLLGGVATVAGAVFIGGTTAMLTLFVIARFDRLTEGACRFVVASRRDRTRRLAGAMLDNVGAYLVGAVLIGACAGTAALLWCVAADIPYPLMLALVVGVFDMIPQIGATIGSVVVIGVALSVSLPTALVTVVFFLVYQGLENWIVYPRVMSRAVKISNLAAIVSALVGGALFGVVGVVIAVPLYASVQLLVREVVFPRQESR